MGNDSKACSNMMVLNPAGAAAEDDDGCSAGGGGGFEGGGGFWAEAFPGALHALPRQPSLPEAGEPGEQLGQTLLPHRRPAGAKHNERRTNK
eukprot:1179177-Prorocentrum_minimum.AAC.1